MRRFEKEQELVVTLRVSDARSMRERCDPTAAPAPQELFSPNVAILQYRITCGNHRPVADAGPNIDRFFEAGTYPSEFVALDGRTSHDPDGGIQSYIWSCPGAKQGPIPTGVPGVAYCQYEGFGEWTARLQVRDDGVPGTGICQKTDQDEVRIRFLESGTAE